MPKESVNEDGTLKNGPACPKCGRPALWKVEGGTKFKDNQNHRWIPGADNIAPTKIGSEESEGAR